MVFQNLRFKNTSAGGKTFKLQAASFFILSSVAAIAKVHVSLFQGLSLFQRFAFKMQVSLPFSKLSTIYVLFFPGLAISTSTPLQHFSMPGLWLSLGPQPNLKIQVVTLLCPTHTKKQTQQNTSLCQHQKWSCWTVQSPHASCFFHRSGL